MRKYFWIRLNPRFSVPYEILKIALKHHHFVSRRRERRQNASKPVAGHFNLSSHSEQHMAVCGLSLRQGNTETPQNFSFKSALLILTVSTNAFHSTNLLCYFSRYQAPTNSIATSFCIETIRDPQFLDSLPRRAKARNVSFRISLRWPRYLYILTRLRGFRVKIVNLLSFFCLSIPRGDLHTKKATPNIEV